MGGSTIKSSSIITLTLTKYEVYKIRVGLRRCQESLIAEISDDKTSQERAEVLLGLIRVYEEILEDITYQASEQENNR